MKYKQLLEGYFARTNAFQSRMEDRLDSMEYRRPFMRLPRLEMRSFLMLCISVLCLAISYKIITW